MSALWTAAEAATATGGVTGCNWQASGISIDTRTLRPGDLFVALTDARDGHDFVAAALDKGAAAALVSRVPDGVAPDRLLLVPNVLPALEALGRAGRARTTAKVLAITGSVGKTSTKDMAVAALKALGARVHAAEASLNNHWGVPLTLARMPRDTDYAVLEIGMNHPGEIEPLARMARPHVALITTVAAAHLEAFSSLDDIAVEKAAIFRGLEAGGIAVIPEGLAVTPVLRAGAGDAPLRSFGSTGDARLLEARTEAGCTHVRAQIAGHEVTFSIASVGQHFALNAVGVLAALDAMGVDLAAVGAGLADWRPYAGRGAIEDLGGVTLLDDSYNANPTSLSAGLAMLTRLPGARHMAILGDMLELGEAEIAMHAIMADDPAMAAVDLVHACGPRMRALMDALPAAKRGIWAEDAAGLIARAGDLVRDGDIVLIKGSKSSRVASVVDALRAARHMPAPRKG